MVLYNVGDPTQVPSVLWHLQQVIFSSWFGMAA